MARQLQLRRGTNAENNLFTGAVAEVTVDTDKKALRVHDGSTQGGYTINSYSTDNKTISPTSSNVLQAIGQVNKRNNTPVYTWTGTKSEYASLGTYHSDWVYVVTSDSTVEDHRVIAFQKPTAGNNYTWYRKYADGWVEQGGICTERGYQTINFSVQMLDVNYFVSLTSRRNATTKSGDANDQVLIPNCTNLSMYVYVNDTSNNGVYWQVSGMYAE